MLAVAEPELAGAHLLLHHAQWKALYTCSKNQRVRLLVSICMHLSLISHKGLASTCLY